MVETALIWIEGSAPAQYLSSSRYAYPLVNAAHILALAALFGSILALDLRLLGLWRAIPARALALTLPRLAASGLAFAVLTGLLLFSVQPRDYAAHPAFLIKVALVAIGATHVLLVHRGTAWKALVHGGESADLRLKLSAAVSLAIWTSAIVAGRFIAF